MYNRLKQPLASLPLPEMVHKWARDRVPHFTIAETYRQAFDPIEQRGLLRFHGFGRARLEKLRHTLLQAGLPDIGNPREVFEMLELIEATEQKLIGSPLFSELTELLGRHGRDNDLSTVCRILNIAGVKRK